MRTQLSFCRNGKVDESDEGHEVHEGHERDEGHFLVLILPDPARHTGHSHRQQHTATAILADPTRHTRTRTCFTPGQK